MCEPHRCGWLGTGKRVVFLSAVLGVLVHGLLDIALGLWVCHMDVDGLCDAHVLSTSYVQSVSGSTTIDHIYNYCHDANGDVHIHWDGARARLPAMRHLIMGRNRRCPVDCGLAGMHV